MDEPRSLLDHLLPHHVPSKPDEHILGGRAEGRGEGGGQLVEGAKVEKISLMRQDQVEHFASLTSLKDLVEHFASLTSLKDLVEHC